MSIGTLELFFRAGDLFVWNEDGSRFWIAFYLGTLQRLMLLRVMVFDSSWHSCHSFTYSPLFRFNFNFVPIVIDTLHYLASKRCYSWSNETWHIRLFGPHGQSWLGCGTR
jgi:hypothetical protein